VLHVIGVLRCAAYTSTVNHPLYAPPDDPAQDQSAIQHFYDKLVHIRDRLKTEPGRKLGEKRHRVVSLDTSLAQYLDIARGTDDDL
jgi:uncharacterized protein